MHWWKILLIVIVVLVIFVVGAGFVWRGKTKVDPNNLPQFIQADFIDLDKIYSISKFRSGSGHDFSSNGETCRSMKHYFNVQDTREKFAAWDNNGLPPPPDGKNDISIYSPVDGKITQVAREQTPIGEQIYIRPDNAPDFIVRLFHIYLDSGIGKGTKVTAGQKIGSIGQYQNTDIAVQVGGFRGSFVPYFQVMPDSVFTKYKARGVKNREEFIITKEYRDAHPLQCKGEQFANRQDNFDNTEDFVHLSGWQNPNQSGPMH